jgi:predicted DNA-binding transcriptional regulator AlpA
MDGIKVVTATPLSDMRLLVTFNNGIIKLYDAHCLLKDFPYFETLENPDIFGLVSVEPGGYGVSWTPELDTSEGELWTNGTELPLSAEDLRVFVKRNILSTAEVMEILGCSRKNVDDMIKRKNISPVKAYPKSNLFMRGEITRKQTTHNE